MSRFFAMFPIGIGVQHADLLETNLLSLAARHGVEIEVVKVDASTVRVMLPSGLPVIGSDFENLAHAVVRA